MGGATPGIAAHTSLERRRSRVHRLESRPGLAGWPTRLAGHGRHATELEHRLESALTSAVGRRVRALHMLRLRLEALDLGRRIGRISARLASAREQLTRTMQERQGGRAARLQAAAARLEALSPLAVLARGYAVCWNADRSEIIREAAGTRVGDAVTVTLHKGEIRCEVKKTT